MKFSSIVTCLLREGGEGHARERGNAMRDIICARGSPGSRLRCAQHTRGLRCTSQCRRSVGGRRGCAATAGIALGTGRHAAVSRAPCGEKGSITKTLTPNGPDRASSGPHGGCRLQSSALGDPQTSSCDLSSRWQVGRTHTIGAEPRGRSGRVSGADQ